MLFALEVILGKFGSRYVASVVIGSVAASVVSRAFLGPEPAFVMPAYGLNSPLELPCYFVMSIFAAFVSIAITRTMTGVEDVFNRLKPPR